MAEPDHHLWRPSQFNSGAGISTMSSVASYITAGYYARSSIRLEGGSTKGSLTKSGLSYAAGYNAMGVSLLAAAGDQIFWEASNGTRTLFRLVSTGTAEEWKMERWNGSGYVQVGSTVTSPTLTSAVRLDISWSIADSGGFFRVYVAGSGTAALEFIGDTLHDGGTTITAITITAPTTNANSSYFWDFFIDASDTRDLRCIEDTSSAAGTYSEYTGTETNVDDIVGVNSYTAVVTFDANSERGTFTYPTMDADVTDSWVIEAVKFAFAAHVPTDPALYLQGIARISSTDYDGDDYVQPVAGVQGEGFYEVNFAVNPATAAAWANKTAVESAQFGVQALTTP